MDTLTSLEGFEDFQMFGQFESVQTGRRSLLLPSLARQELRLPPMLAAPRASSLRAPSLSGTSTGSSSMFDSRPATPLDTERLAGLNLFDVQEEFNPPFAPKLKTVDLPDVGEIGDFGVDTSSDYGLATDYINEDDYKIDLDEINIFKRVSDWQRSHEGRDTVGTYADALAESLEDACPGPLCGETPRPVRSALPAAPALRVASP